MCIDDPIPAPPQAPCAASPPCPPLPLLAAADLQDSLMVATSDLDRLQRLLTDATDTLMAHFVGASAALGGLAGCTAPPGGSADPLQPLRQHLAGAVTALQFQDMASQLISHTLRRLHGCTDQLARDVMGDEDDDGAALLPPAPLRPNPVTQDEMDAGSVELF